MKHILPLTIALALALTGCAPSTTPEPEDENAVYFSQGDNLRIEANSNRRSYIDGADHTVAGNKKFEATGTAQEYSVEITPNRKAIERAKETDGEYYSWCHFYINDELVHELKSERTDPTLTCTMKMRP